MVRINTKSAFGQLDLEDAASIRRVLVAIDYTLSNSVVDSRSEEIELLRGVENNVTRTLLTMIRGQMMANNGLLLHAVLRFLEARNGSDEGVLAAARRLEELADLDVFTQRAVYGVEYAAAEARFQEESVTDTYLRGQPSLFLRAPGAFGNQGDSARAGAQLEMYRQAVNPTWYPSVPTSTMIPAGHRPPTIPEPDMASSASPESLKQPPAPPNSEVDDDTLESSPYRQKPKLIRGKKSGKKPTVTFEEPATDPDETEVEDESDNKLEPKIKASEKKAVFGNTDPVPEGVNPARWSRGYRDTHPNKPVRHPSQRIIDNGDYDRVPAVVGEMDESKMILSFDCERLNKKTGLYVPDGKLHYKCRKNVDWDDKDSVVALQRWRQQSFGRAIGPEQPAREMWLESERDLLLGILQQHLADVGGRLSKAPWKAIAAAYNEALRGTTQVAGELSAERLYTFTIKGKDEEVEVRSKGHRLPKDRTAPVRSILACQNQLKAFTDEKVVKALADAVEADKKAGYLHKKRSGKKASSKPDSPKDGEGENDPVDEEIEEEGDEVEEDPEDGDDHENHHGNHKRRMDEDDDDAGPSTKRHADFLAAEERRITGARQAAKDRAGNKWIKGG
ncbi:hypothetical protein VTL71DRAFT_4497 [Oculimacula yallundae]|uniref:Uncharacterized protein n=1 Tax=Oculimacula yallundae TaxID=86028 RepID=A0ABR4C233_9HELO